MDGGVRTFHFERFSRDKWKGIRILTTRYWPRFVTRREGRRYYDAWLPTLAPSPSLIRQFRQGRIDWPVFKKRYLKEMSKTEARQVINMLASLSRKQQIHLGCGCENERMCHRTLLKGLVSKAVKAN